MGNEQVSKTKNANDKTLEDIDEESLYAVSESKEIYVCINATNKEHDCKFGLCRDCYCKHAPSRSSRKRKSDDDDSSCSHKCYSTLHQFFDNQFFTTKYMAQIVKRKIAWTSHCSECNIKFVTKGRNGRII